MSRFSYQLVIMMGTNSSHILGILNFLCNVKDFEQDLEYNEDHVRAALVVIEKKQSAYKRHSVPGAEEREE